MSRIGAEPAVILEAYEMRRTIWSLTFPAVSAHRRRAALHPQAGAAAVFPAAEAVAAEAVAGSATGF